MSGGMRAAISRARAISRSSMTQSTDNEQDDQLTIEMEAA